MPNALCRGKAPLFDSWIDGETEHDRAHRHHQARNLCHQCQHRTTCGKSIGGIRAGRDTTPDRPRKATA